MSYLRYLCLLAYNGDQHVLFTLIGFVHSGVQDVLFTLFGFVYSGVQDVLFTLFGFVYSGVQHVLFTLFGFVYSGVQHLFSFLCCVFCFVCRRLDLYAPNVATFSGLSFLDYL